MEAHRKEWSGKTPAPKGKKSMFRSIFNMTAARTAKASPKSGKSPSRKRKPQAWRLVEFSDGRVVRFPA